TETCRCCKRDGWTRQVHYSLYNKEEYGHPIVVKGLPKGYEPMMASAGSSVYEAVKEAMEYCQKSLFKFKGVGFDFNGKTVLVDSLSTEEAVVAEWWKARYGE